MPWRLNCFAWMIILFPLSPWITAAEPEAKPELVRVARKPDPYGVPRPGPGEQHVPLSTSLYFELAVRNAAKDDVIDPDSVTIQLEPDAGEPIPVLDRGSKFAAGYSGRLFPGKSDKAGPTLAVYVDSERPLKPLTRYTVRIAGRSRSGLELPAASRPWQFTTEAASAVHPLHFDLDLDSPSAAWQGGFFSGFCGVSFATNHKNRIPTFERLAEAVNRIEKLSRLQETRTESQLVKPDGRLTLRVQLPVNAASFLVLRPIEGD